MKTKKLIKLFGVFSPISITSLSILAASCNSDQPTEENKNKLSNKLNELKNLQINNAETLNNDSALKEKVENSISSSTELLNNTNGTNSQFMQEIDQLTGIIDEFNAFISRNNTNNNDSQPSENQNPSNRIDKSVLKTKIDKLNEYKVDSEIQKNHSLHSKIIDKANKSQNLYDNENASQSEIDSDIALIDKVLKEAENYKNGNTGTDNPSGEQVPPIPPNFPNFFKQDRTKFNKYPDYASRYTPVKAEDIYKEIYDRTFSVQIYTHVKAENTDVQIDQGTAWVLDYHKSSNDQNKVKLFLATNVHVLGDFSNTMDTKIATSLFPQYSDPTGNTVSGIALGRAENPKFETLPNKTSQTSGNLSYFTNNEKLTQQATGNRNTYWATTYTKAIGKPTLIFAAVDFMKEEALEAYKDKISARIDETLSSKDPNAEYYKTWKTEGKKPHVYVDFAVFSVDIDLSQANDKLKKWVNDSTTAVDNYLKRLKDANNLPNQNKNVSSYMQTLDYVSKYLNPNKHDGDYEYALDSAKNLYIAGYPKADTTKFAHNNPTERNSETLADWYGTKYKDLFAYQSNDHEIQSGSFRINKAWNKPLAGPYGVHYNISFSSLNYGASGSVVYNDFGQIVGVYDSVSTNREDSNDLLGKAGFAPLLQSTDISDLSNSFTSYAYNLIDGTDTNKYPKQKDSYRSNLEKLFPKGFEDGTKKTALFPNGF
ncbi:MIP family Ig-specific serine endopeptidase [Mycoplasmopsis meleagridis]|uniref:MIP family Ig-specific serine endopeptidase n=1 Tax=Mycoplasmopsis meleagridis TaxID=29561 RepID=UPI0006977650|nr:DUF31 family protein [Mycoplasmopsis meleagridis]VEU77488.1 Domain of uncharacterised function DUF31 [Mycoplasmopsis meleagridis]